MKQIQHSTGQLLDAIVEGILRKKGRDLISMDFSTIENAICDYFVICDADTNTHVDAIASSVEDYVKENYQFRPYFTEGFENAEWVLLDYGNIIVHVFQKQYRERYRLEDLWADAKIAQIEDKLIVNK